ncbi:hypothetical protein [Micromonospora endolithica]|uniref:Uncharacterized protein n=1 Tax=Micromonospora endolithica TaxID=230091 RepID=A0A3A9ZRP7_9ACTN|nr:hypothetical protein [Micromonospora endolithica]RKN50942.1 hypothetical protein D7223_04150 [Micromonospora endolithica]
MSQQDKVGSRSLNTYPEASGGQRVTAHVVALVVAPLVGLLCAWLATSLLDGAHWLVQTVVFALIGLVFGVGVLALLARPRTRGRR